MDAEEPTQPSSSSVSRLTAMLSCRDTSLRDRLWKNTLESEPPVARTASSNFYMIVLALATPVLYAPPGKCPMLGTTRSLSASSRFAPGASSLCSDSKSVSEPLAAAPYAAPR